MSEDEVEEVGLCEGGRLVELIRDEAQFLEVPALGQKLAWEVIDILMARSGRTVNKFQHRVVSNALENCTLPIFCQVTN